MAKARADKRARLTQAAQALLGKAMLLWPANDVRDLMSQDTKLMSAYEKVDLIAWVNALKEFCLEGTGNVDNNIRLAEDYITKLKMKPTRFTAYVNEFKAAAENLATCGSTFTQERIVTLFIKNLDQVAFLNFFVNFLDCRHSLNELKTGTLQEAITVVLRYYNQVIRSCEEDDGSSLTGGTDGAGGAGGGGGGGGGGSPSPVKVNSAKGLKEAVAVTKAGGEFLVSHAVLAAFVRKTGTKRKAHEVSAAAAATPPAKKGKCFAFGRGEVCKFGSQCKFEH
jgi:hypothetical protein